MYLQTGRTILCSVQPWYKTCWLRYSKTFCLASNLFKPCWIKGNAKTTITEQTSGPLFECKKYKPKTAFTATSKGEQITSNKSGTFFIRPESSMTVFMAKPCLTPTSKSLQSWPGVILTAPVSKENFHFWIGLLCCATLLIFLRLLVFLEKRKGNKIPVPFFLSAYWSQTMGNFSPLMGCRTCFWCKCVYLASSGCTAIAVSPNIVSGRVVSTVTNSSAKNAWEYFN